MAGSREAGVHWRAALAAVIARERRDFTTRAAARQRDFAASLRNLRQETGHGYRRGLRGVEAKPGTTQKAVGTSPSSGRCASATYAIAGDTPAFGRGLPGAS